MEEIPCAQPSNESLPAIAAHRAEEPSIGFLFSIFLLGPTGCAEVVSFWTSAHPKLLWAYRRTRAPEELRALAATSRCGRSSALVWLRAYCFAARR